MKLDFTTVSAMLSPASWNSSAPMPPVWVAHVRRSTDSIGWAGLPHDPQYRCIHPPPFGQQCTLLRRDALLSCLIMPGCVALTCPDPSESHIGRKPGITGPICQARREAVAREYNHGMCKPSGCINIAFRSPANRSVHNYTTLVLQRVPSRAWTHVGVVRFRAASGLKEALTHLLPEIAAVHPMGAEAPRAASDAHTWELESTIAQVRLAEAMEGEYCHLLPLLHCLGGILDISEGCSFSRVYRVHVNLWS